MKAWIAGKAGPELAEIDQPEPGPHDVLVQVRACALNRADLFMAGGGTHGAAGGPGAVLGLEWAGEVVQLGADVEGVKLGDQVMGSGGAAYAQYTVADYGRLIPIPEGMDFGQAAAMPVALQTMLNAVVTEGQIERGQSVLIHGASSGVGIMGLQVARAMGASLVVGSARNPERRKRLLEFGANLTVDPEDENWVDAIKAETDGKGVDLVVDMISGPGINQTMRATKVKGRIVNVGRLGGNVAPMDFNLHALRRISYIGVTFRSRTKHEIREIARQMQADLGQPLAEGKLKLPVDAVYPFADLPAALEHMAANRHFGKIVLQGAMP